MVMAGLRSSLREKGAESRFLLRESEDRVSCSRLLRELLMVEDDGGTTDLDLEGGRDASEPLVDMAAVGRNCPLNKLRKGELYEMMTRNCI